MNEVSSTIHEDLGVVTERLIPFAPRSETREKLWELHDEFREKASNIGVPKSRRSKNILNSRGKQDQ